MHIRAFYLLVLLSCGICIPSVGVADVFKYRDAQGHIHLTDQPMRGMTLLKRFSISTGRQARSTPRRSSPGPALAAMLKRRDVLAPLIETAAVKNKLRPELVHAVVRAESAYRADAESHKGAVGLMQLMPATAKRYGVVNRRDPAQNLRGGTEYLRDLLVMFDNDLQLALAAYNAGENAVIRYGHKIPPYNETQGYVRKVIRFYNDMIGRDQLASR